MRTKYTGLPLVKRRNDRALIAGVNRAALRRMPHRDIERYKLGKVRRIAVTLIEQIG